MYYLYFKLNGKNYRDGPMDHKNSHKWYFES